MDKVDFDYELGHAIKGSRIYPSIDALKKALPCVESCGIVEIEITLKQVIQETDFSKRIARAKERIAQQKCDNSTPIR